MNHKYKCQEIKSACHVHVYTLMNPSL